MAAGKEHYVLSVHQPNTAMKKNKRRAGSRSVSGNIQIEFEFEVVCFCIGNVREDVVINGSIVDPTIRIRLRPSRNRYPQITQKKK